MVDFNVVIDGVIEGGVLVDGAAKSLFGGKFDQYTWMVWLPDDGAAIKTNRQVHCQDSILLLVRYGNKNIAVWKIEDGEFTPKCIFIPAKHGFGRNKAIPVISAYAEVLLNNLETAPLEFITLPKRVIGFKASEVPDVSEMDLQGLAAFAKSSDPSKMETAIKRFKVAGDLVFVPESCLPADFVAGYDQPWCLDMAEYFDSEGYPIPQMAKQTALTRHGLHYGAASRARVIRNKAR